MKGQPLLVELDLPVDLARFFIVYAGLRYVVGLGHRGDARHILADAIMVERCLVRNVFAEILAGISQLGLIGDRHGLFERVRERIGQGPRRGWVIDGGHIAERARSLTAFCR